MEKNLTYYDEELEQTIKFLDSIPIDKYITGHVDIYDIVNRIENDYGPSLEDNSTFEGCVFNWMNSDEFAYYLRKRGYRVQENISYEVWK